MAKPVVVLVLCTGAVVVTGVADFTGAVAVLLAVDVWAICGREVGAVVATGGSATDVVVCVAVVRTGVLVVVVVAFVVVVAALATSAGFVGPLIKRVTPKMPAKRTATPAAPAIA